MLYLARTSAFDGLEFPCIDAGVLRIATGDTAVRLPRDVRGKRVAAARAGLCHYVHTFYNIWRRWGREPSSCRLTLLIGYKFVNLRKPM